ncbi:MAG: glycosyltransferase family 2 protein [Ignavibacteriales bacterium]
MMRLSVVVPYHSNQSLLDACISTLVETVRDDVEIILVKNNANEAEIAVPTKPNRVKNIIIPRNLGYSKAVNIGVEKCDGELVVLADADTFFKPGWLEALTKFHVENNMDGLSASQLISPSSGRVTDYGMALTKLNNTHPFKDRPVGHPLVSRARRVQMACSACMMIRRDVFEEVGGMDPELHNFYQDTDLCLRLKERGHPVWVVANSLVYHQGDSAKSMRAPYRADVKAVYGAKNWHRMSVDMDGYFREAVEFARSIGIDLAPPRRLIDLSSVGDHAWHQELFQSIFKLSGIMEFFSACRDAEDISLLNELDAHLRTHREPLIYFVDRYPAVRKNAFWIEARRGRGDLVIDRNANIMALEQVND